jgi:hypothetical protein
MAETFEQALKQAHIAEQILATHFLEVGCAVEWTNEKGTGRDMLVRIRGVVFGVEVKDEENFRDSGNIAIERAQNLNGDPSGLGITTADIWIHVFGSGGPYMAYRVIPMKRFLSRNKQAYPIRPFGKSDNANKGNLVPVAVLQTQPWADYCESFGELYMSSVWELES